MQSKMSYEEYKERIIGLFLERGNNEEDIWYLKKI